ncbi:MAG TPA: hypothetical protein PKE23_08075 [Anaerolineales bacterium]|nr:hypothetical protein [Anaerolineales bacterium]
MDQRNKSIQQDNELADFVDQLLDGKNPPASTSDEELVGLEKTLLRLNDAFPPETLDEAKSKQMLARLKTRMRREEEEKAAKPSFWSRLFDLQANPQVGLLIAAAVVVFVIVSFPAVVQPSGSAVSGTASSGGSMYVGLGLLALLFIVYLVSRKK